MKQHLADTFRYNDWANRKLLDTILQLPDKGEAVRLFSHLVSAQNKWMNRITNVVEDASLQWYEPVYLPEELEEKWAESVDGWLALLEQKSEADLEEAVTFQRASDGKRMAVKLGDLALQLNYHIIHHRAQIAKLISAQGVAVPATDYIFTVLREVE